MTRQRGKSRKPKSGRDSDAALPPLRPDGTRDWSNLEARAKRETDRNAGRIEAGETFRAQKPTGPEGAPSKNRDGRYS
jgi:hypothetical protein